MIAQGDYFQGEVNYTQGALRYLDHTGNAPTLFYERGNGAAYGLMVIVSTVPLCTKPPQLLNPARSRCLPTRLVAS